MSPEIALACPSCELSRKRADSLLIDLENAEIQMRTMRRDIGRLKAELAKQRTDDPQMDEAERIFEYWRKRIAPRAKAFGADRQKAVLARLHEGWTEADLKMAIEGARIGAYVDEKGKRHNDLELICRSDRYVLRFIDIFKRAEREAHRQHKLARCLEYARRYAVLHDLHTEDDVQEHAEWMLSMIMGDDDDREADADPDPADAGGATSLRMVRGSVGHGSGARAAA